MSETPPPHIDYHTPEASKEVPTDVKNVRFFFGAILAFFWVPITFAFTVFLGLSERTATIVIFGIPMSAGLGFAISKPSRHFGFGLLITPVLWVVIPMGLCAFTFLR